MEQTNELLLHFTSAVRTDSLAGSHKSLLELGNNFIGRHTAGKPLLTFTIDFEAAKRYREANKMPHQFRRAAWTDLTVEVYL